ncbi:MAG: hypothetical protein M3N39_10480 [Pseudomonadota bacterium]|nr:hypothetical protein [Pseudomonadota bacterium]
MLQKNPEWAAGHALLASLRWTLGRSAEFGASYERALRQHPSSHMLWMAFIQQLIQAGMYVRADEAVARARSAAGGSLTLDITEACCATETGDLDRADSLFARAQVLEDARVAPWYIRHLLRAGRPDEAARFGESLVEDL